MNVLYVTAEMPFSKAGGLGDVSGALPSMLKKLDIDIQIITPYYTQIISHGLLINNDILNFSMNLGKIHVDVAIHSTIYEGTSVYFVDIPFYFNRKGIYTTDDGIGYTDNEERFASFCWAVLEYLYHSQWFPDIIHLNDWHCAFLPVWMQMDYFKVLFLKYKKPKTLLTIHNIAYQGSFSVEKYAVLGIKDPNINALLTFQDHANPLKASIISVDAISTVSKSYAQEILDPEYSSHMETFLKNRSDPPIGILNGVEYTVWNPDFDPLIPANFSLNDLSGKSICKRKLQEKFKLKNDPNIPLIGIISRLASQKGFDIIIPSLEPLLKTLNFQLIAYVNGNKLYAIALKEIELKYPDKISINIEYDEVMSHWVEAGSDFFLMPSKYEPCGLNQLYSLRYGTIPIVRATGGLKDTITDIHEHPEDGTGFSFTDYTPLALQNAINRALSWYIEALKMPTVLVEFRKRLMRKDFSWYTSAQQYKTLYQKILS